MVQFTRALEMDPRRPGLFADDFGWTCLFLRRYQEAERHMSRAISMAPEQLMSYLWKAQVYIARDGDIERARETIEGALGVATLTESVGIFEALLVGSQIRILPETYGELLGRLDRESSGPTSDVDRAFLRLAEAELHAAKNETELAAAYYDSTRVLLERMVQVRPSIAHLPYIRSALGLVYAGLGSKEKAIREAEGAVELLPVSEDAADGPDLLQALAEVYVRIGEYEAAIDQLEILLSIPSGLSVPLLRIDPVWDPLRDHPRFQSLLEKYSGGAS